MKNLILFQENQGQVEFLDSISDPTTKRIVQTFIDGLAETFMSIKTSLQSFGYYDRVINLTDVKCTKAKLLEEMISQSKSGHVFDLLILGHGRNKELVLHGGDKMTDIHIKGLLTTARQQYPGLNFKLRMVYMCNCFAGTLLDAWVSIGAKVALGCKQTNYMPEPQITFFFNDFVKNGFGVKEANQRSFDASNRMWTIAGLSESKRIESRLSVKGEDIRFEGRRLALNETVEKDIYAKTVYNNTDLLLIEKDKYEFKVASSDKWKNSSHDSTDANGYAKGLFDVPRQSSYNMMALVGEIFNDNGNALTYTGTSFKIGTSKTWTVSKTGFLVCHANDALPFYGDNSGKVTVKIKRVA